MSILPNEGFHNIYFVMKNQGGEGELIGMVDWIRFDMKTEGGFISQK
mgnify:CR=1 FL=1